MGKSCQSLLTIVGNNTSSQQETTDKWSHCQLAQVGGVKVPTGGTQQVQGGDIIPVHCVCTAMMQEQLATQTGAGGFGLLLLFAP